MSDFQGSVTFCSFHFWFLVFGHFWQRSYKNMKLFRNLCLHFARQNGQDGKNSKGNHATKEFQNDQITATSWSGNTCQPSNQLIITLIRLLFIFCKAKNHATKVTKIPKTKRRKYGMNQTPSFMSS